MLVVTRTAIPHVGRTIVPGINTIHIDGPCTIVLVDVLAGCEARIGIHAEQSVTILRGELVGKPDTKKRGPLDPPLRPADEVPSIPINLTPSVDCGACDRGKD